MSDTKELRRLAQAATPGPWVSKGRYIGTPRHMSYIGEVRDQCGNWSDTEKSRADAAFIAAANPAAIIELISRFEAVESDAIHQKALADSALRVAEGWERRCDALRAKIAQMERQVPICRAEDLKHAESLLPALGLKPENHLYALPGAHPKPDCGEAGHDEGRCGNKQCLPGAQPALSMPNLHVGNLPTANQDAYPALGAWWVQLWDGDDVIARVYGATPEEAHSRAVMLAATGDRS